MSDQNKCLSFHADVNQIDPKYGSRVCDVCGLHSYPCLYVLMDAIPAELYVMFLNGDRFNNIDTPFNCYGDYNGPGLCSLCDVKFSYKHDIYICETCYENTPLSSYPSHVHVMR